MFVSNKTHDKYTELLIKGEPEKPGVKVCGWKCGTVWKCVVGKGGLSGFWPLAKGPLARGQATGDFRCGKRCEEVWEGIYPAGRR